MTDVTITLDDDLADWAKLRAAEREISLSRLIADMLRRSRDEGVGSYETAMRDFFSFLETDFGLPGERPSREELNVRENLR